jgi:ABC-type multidrug transport system fused ATPase/permease subunit
MIEKILGVKKKTFLFVLDEPKRYFKKLVWVLPLTAWSAVFYQVSPIFTKWQIDSLTNNWQGFFGINLESTLKVFALILLLNLFLQFLNNLFDYLQTKALLRINQETEAFLEDRFLNFLTHFDGAFLGSENNMRLIRSLYWRFGSIQEKVTAILNDLVKIIFGFASLIFILPLIHPYLLIIILFSIFLDSILDYFQNQRWRQFELVESRQHEQKMELRWRIFNYFNQIIANNWLGQISSSYSSRRQKHFNTKFDQDNGDKIFHFFKSTQSVFIDSLAALTGAFLVLNGEIGLGTFVIFGFYVSRLQSQFQIISSLVRNFFEIRFELLRFDFLLHIKPKLDYQNIQKFSDDEIKSITLKNLNFKYPEFYKEEMEYFDYMKKRIGILTSNEKPKNWLAKIQAKISKQSISIWQQKNLQQELKELEKLITASDKMILKDLNLELKKGNIYAVVGYNGAGKSTLTKLIKRSIDPTTGEIIINKTKLTTIEPLFWKKYLASLEQESFLWESLSVRENLSLGSKQQYSDEQLFLALEKVGLKEKITDLDLILGENLELSGGESQLLEIARVYLQKKPIIIMDEGTNQLDAIREARILEILQEIKKDSIIIFITHRMTTCLKCDEVIVLENGQIQITGKPKLLLGKDQDNLFKTFWETQLDTSG